MRTLVMKFGGTSVGNLAAIQQTASIIQKHKTDWDNLVVVVSAMSGITDKLIQSARLAAENNGVGARDIINQIQNQHLEVVNALVSDPMEKQNLLTVLQQRRDELSSYCQSIQVLGEVTPRGMDVISSLGERINAQVVASVLRGIGTPAQAVEATECIITDRSFQNAVPDMQRSREKIQSNLTPLFQQSLVPVVTGFMAATQDGIITTLGRGGSDYTAAILADCLDADEVWIWTDVDGVLSADPRLVPDARPIPEISFAEVGELAYFGAKVLHPKTIRPVVNRNMPLWVKNTFNPDFLGTRITQNPSRSRGEITAISMIKDLSILTVEGRGMLGVPGIAARTFGAVARTGASVLMISQSSSEQSICFTIPSLHNGEVIKSIESEMALELLRGDIDRVWAHDHVVIVSIIGSGMRETPGVSARIFGALGKNLINVIAIAQGSSEYSISLVLDQKDAVRAVQAIHAETAPSTNGG
ncbi:MAG TPA: aspartate kinase [Anaerolineales bacterium]|nr:aspartate kinase [Anaerolineales bacterium]